jgi:hypothetical protein
MDDPKQSQRFIEAARELGADQSEEAFDEALRRIARAPASAKGPTGRKHKTTGKPPEPKNKHAKRTATKQRLKGERLEEEKKK